MGREENAFTILYFLLIKLYTLSVKLCYGMVMDGVAPKGCWQGKGVRVSATLAWKECAT